MAEYPSDFDKVKYNGQWVDRDSPLGQEAAKWEKPYQFVPYPAMMYRAQRLPGNGKWATAAPLPQRYAFSREEDWAFAKMQAEAFTRECQRVVNDDRERRAALDTGEGWQDTPQEAIDWQLNLEKLMGQEAAERAYRDRNMSEGAKAESAAAEAEHFGHLPSIPEKPRRGRPRKAVTTPAT